MLTLTTVVLLLAGAALPALAQTVPVQLTKAYEVLLGSSNLVVPFAPTRAMATPPPPLATCC